MQSFRLLFFGPWLMFSDSFRTTLHWLKGPAHSSLHECAWHWSERSLGADLTQGSPWGLAFLETSWSMSHAAGTMSITCHSLCSWYDPP